MKWIYGQDKLGEKFFFLSNSQFPSVSYCYRKKNITSLKSDSFSLPASWSQSMNTATLISNVHWLLTAPPSLICNDCLWTFLVQISHAAISLQNNVSLATGPQSCMATSSIWELWLCLITTEIMRVGKGFVLPLRTPVAADRATGIFSCSLCWCADRRAHRGSDTS